MLSTIPWLLRELDNRIAHFDKISVGTIGRTRSQHNGDTTCPRATAEIIALIETSHNDTAALLAAAIAAIAKDHP